MLGTLGWRKLPCSSRQKSLASDRANQSRLLHANLVPLNPPRIHLATPVHVPLQVVPRVLQNFRGDARLPAKTTGWGPEKSRPIVFACIGCKGYWVRVRPIFCTTLRRLSTCPETDCPRRRPWRIRWVDFELPLHRRAIAGGVKVTRVAAPTRSASLLSAWTSASTNGMPSLSLFSFWRSSISPGK